MSVLFVKWYCYPKLSFIKFTSYIKCEKNKILKMKVTWKLKLMWNKIQLVFTSNLNYV